MLGDKRKALTGLVPVARGDAVLAYDQELLIPMALAAQVGRARNRLEEAKEAASAVA